MARAAFILYYFCQLGYNAHNRADAPSIQNGGDTTMFDAGNLITLGVVLVILIAYRILDRDNRSLEKVKKYTDRLKDELDAMATERAQALKGYAIEVDTHKKSAKEVLRQVQEAETDLGKRAEGISIMAQRIGEYDKALTELKTMSLRVDENLRTIHEESHFADTLAKTLHNSKNELEKISKEIPLLREEARRQAQASSQGLSEQFDQKLQAASKTAEQSYASIRDELAAAFDQARAEAVKLEASSFQQLKQQIDQRGAELGQVLQDTARQLQGNSEKNRQELEQHTLATREQALAETARIATALQQDMEMKAAELQSLLDKQDEKLSTLVAKRFDDIEQFAAERSGKLEDAVETRFTALKEQASEKVRETQGLLKSFKQDWHKEAEEVLAQARQEAEAVAGRLEPLISQANTAIDRSSVESAARLQQIEEKHQETAQAIQHKFKETLKAWQEDLTRQQQELKAGLKQSILEAGQEANKLKQEVESGLSDAGKRLAAAATEQTQRLSSMETALANAEDQSMKTLEALNDKFITRGADLESRVLAGFDKRSDALRSLVEQGLERLEASRLDVQQMEKALRQSMAGVETRVEEDFALFAKDVTGRHETFEAKLAAEAAKLQNAMKALDEDLQTLKANAYDNVSEQLKIFEDEFFNDLRKRREDTDTKLQVWRSSLDERLAAALHEADTARAETERGWLEESRKRAGEIQQRVSDALDKLSAHVEAHRAAISERVSEADAALTALRGSVKTDMDEARTAANAWVQAELARWKQESAENLQRMEQRTLAESARVAELVKTGSAAFDAGREELAKQLELMQTSFSVKLQEVEMTSSAALENLGGSFNTTITALDKDWKQQRDKVVEGSKAERESISRELRNLSEEMDRLRQELAQRSTQALDDFNRIWETRQLEAGKKLQDSEAAMNQSLQTYTKEEKNLQAAYAATREKLQKGLEEERKEREKTFAELDKQLKAFQTQTRLFERADEMKLALSESMESLKADLARADSRRGELAELETQYARIKRAEDEVSQKISRFFAEKRRIDTMEEDFKRLLSLSQAVDQKLASVTSSNDQLVQIQADMRRLMEASSEANEKFDRVEKKSSILDATADAIDKNFQAVSEMERNIRTMDADIRDLPDQIIQLKRSIEEVNAVQPQVKASLERMDSMNGIMAEAEKRAAELQKAREWLARAETRFEELNKKTNEHLKLLNDILKDEPARGKDKSGAPPLSVQESVRKLAHQGWKTDEIARAVKLSRGEVELILELSGDK